MPIYSDVVPRCSPIGLLGHRNRFVYTNDDDVDCYDLSFTDEFNWNINDNWSLNREYRSLVSTRCPYFAKDPNDFLLRCHQHLLPGGTIFFDFGLGDHWRFEEFKIGWIKNGEQEFAYDERNFLWSTLWDAEIAIHPESKKFEMWCKRFGYDDLSAAVKIEVPSIISLDDVRRIFDHVSWNALALWEDSPQLYIFVIAQKKK